MHNGTEATAAYLDLPDMPLEERRRTRTALLTYCRLDTLAMVKILEKLFQLVENNTNPTKEGAAQ